MQVLIMLGKRAENGDTLQKASASCTSLKNPFQAVVGNGAAEGSTLVEPEVPNASIKEVLDLVSSFVSTGSEGQGNAVPSLDLNALNFKKELQMTVV
jgi:hypothetical protein